MNPGDEPIIIAVEVNQDDLETLEELAALSHGLTRAEYVRWLIGHAAQERLTFKLYDSDHAA